MHNNSILNPRNLYKMTDIIITKLLQRYFLPKKGCFVDTLKKSNYNHRVLKIKKERDIV